METFDFGDRSTVPPIADSSDKGPEPIKLDESVVATFESLDSTLEELSEAEVARLTREDIYDTVVTAIKDSGLSKNSLQFGNSNINPMLQRIFNPQVPVRQPSAAQLPSPAAQLPSVASSITQLPSVTSSASVSLNADAQDSEDADDNVNNLVEDPSSSEFGEWLEGLFAEHSDGDGVESVLDKLGLTKGEGIAAALWAFSPLIEKITKWMAGFDGVAFKNYLKDISDTLTKVWSDITAGWKVASEFFMNWSPGGVFYKWIKGIYDESQIEQSATVVADETIDNQTGERTAISLDKQLTNAQKDLFDKALGRGNSWIQDAYTTEAPARGLTNLFGLKKNELDNYVEFQSVWQSFLQDFNVGDDGVLKDEYGTPLMYQDYDPETDESTLKNVTLTELKKALTDYQSLLEGGMGTNLAYSASGLSDIRDAIFAQKLQLEFNRKAALQREENEAAEELASAFGVPYDVYKDRNGFKPDPLDKILKHINKTSSNPKIKGKAKKWKDVRKIDMDVYNNDSQKKAMLRALEMQDTKKNSDVTQDYLDLINNMGSFGITLSDDPKDHFLKWDSSDAGAEFSTVPIYDLVDQLDDRYDMTKLSYMDLFDELKLQLKANQVTVQDDQLRTVLQYFDDERTKSLLYNEGQGGYRHLRVQNGSITGTFQPTSTSVIAVPSSSDGTGRPQK